LRIQYVSHDSTLAELRISAGNGRFARVAEVYVAAGELRDAAAMLTGFPKDHLDLREIQFGSFTPDFSGGAVRLRVGRRDLAGHFFAVITIEPAALDEFVLSLHRLEIEREGDAILIGLPQELSY
jgi:hypothetical protein